MSGAVPIRCVCFDWGGVILKICRSWAEGCARAGLPGREGLSTPEAAARRREISHEYQEGKMSCEEFGVRLSEAMGGVYSPAEIVAVHDAWLIEEYPGVDALVRELNAHGEVQTGMLSNTNQLHWRRQRACPKGSYVHFPTAGMLRHRHASHLLGLAKPNVAIYDAFVRETGFAPGEILFFDDLEENVSAARVAGWKSERIDFNGDTASQMRGILKRYGVLG